jgi:hypothetical protein
MRRWSKTAKGRENDRRNHARYDKTAKGIASRKRRLAKWRASEKGQRWQMLYARKRFTNFKKELTLRLKRGDSNVSIIAWANGSHSFWVEAELEARGR